MKTSFVTNVICALLAITLSACVDDTSSSATDSEDATSPGVPSSVPIMGQDEEENAFPQNPEADVENEGDSEDAELPDVVDPGDVSDEVDEEIVEGQCQTTTDCPTDDLPACTTVECLNNECISIPGNDGLPCDDGDICTENTFCNLAEGGCLGGAETDCNDANPCTIDSCDPVEGCTYTNSPEGCDDGNLCTSDNTCVEGECVAGTTVECDDDNPCTLDSCEPTTGECLSENVEEGADCDDDNPCTETGSCESGACVGVNLEDGTTCDDGTGCNLLGECTEGTCIPEGPAKDGTSCDDGDFCTLNDICKAGVCTPGALKEDAECQGTGQEVPGGLCAGNCGGVYPPDAAPGEAECHCDETCFQYDDCCEGICIDCPELPLCLESSDNCDPGETPTCNPDFCGPLSWVGDGVCDAGFNCEAFNYDDGDCTDTSICLDGEVPSCSGVSCWDESFIGNGSCNSVLNCEAYNFDGGDCEESTTGGEDTCDEGKILDCNSNCSSEDYISDNFCDDGTEYYFDFNCAQFNFDGGDCAEDTGGDDGCTAPLVADCDGNCKSTVWLEDGNCHNGAAGEPNYNCAAWEYDGGDCSGETGGGTSGGGDECDEGEILSCSGLTCWNKSNLGNGECNEYLNCASASYDGGDCSGGTGGDTTGGGDECSGGDIEDCNGTCTDPEKVGDGYCHDGSLFSNFNCAQFNFDNGDCSGGTGGGTSGGDECNPGYILDCDGKCSKESYIGDTYCEDGSDAIGNFDCAQFNFDGGDCTDEDETGTTGGTSGGDEAITCEDDEIVSCSGLTCWSESSLGDGNCQEYLNCAANSFDGGDCN